VLHCHCGFEARAEREGALVAEVRRHAREAHGMTLSFDDAKLLVARAALDERAPTTTPRDGTATTNEEEK
jgi:predicted small metal-binding protein